MTAGVTQMTPPQAPPPQGVSALDVNGALWNAVLTLAGKAAGAVDSRDAGVFATAVKDIASSIVMLDPGLVAPQGVPPEVLARAVPQQSQSPESHSSRGPGG